MNKMNTTRKSAQSAAEDVIAEATTKAKRVRQAVSDKVDDLHYTDFGSDLRDIVRRHPAATLAGAALVGAILSQIVIRSGRR